MEYLLTPGRDIQMFLCSMLAGVQPGNACMSMCSCKMIVGAGTFAALAHPLYKRTPLAPSMYVILESQLPAGMSACRNGMGPEVVKLGQKQAAHLCW